MMQISLFWWSMTSSFGGRMAGFSSSGTSLWTFVDKPVKIPRRTILWEGSGSGEGREIPSPTTSILDQTKRWNYKWTNASFIQSPTVGLFISFWLQLYQEKKDMLQIRAVIGVNRKDINQANSRRLLPKERRRKRLLERRLSPYHLHFLLIYIFTFSYLLSVGDTVKNKRKGK